MPRRSVLRLVVPSPDGRRILARPNGLAGWALPQVAIDLPFDGWTPELLAHAAGVLGADATPVTPLGDDAWAVEVERVGAAGTTWIGESDVERLGTDATIAKRWFGSDVRTRHGTDHEG